MAKVILLGFVGAVGGASLAVMVLCGCSMTVGSPGSLEGAILLALCTVAAFALGGALLGGFAGFRTAGAVVCPACQYTFRATAERRLQVADQWSAEIRCPRCRRTFLASGR